MLAKEVFQQNTNGGIKTILDRVGSPNLAMDLPIIEFFRDELPLGPILIIEVKDLMYLLLAPNFIPNSMFLRLQASTST